MVHLDCSRRVQKALTRNAAPIKEDYQPGDYVVCRRDAQAGGTKWSSASRVIGKEGSESIWVIHSRVPVLCSVHALRPATEEEVMSHCMLQGIPLLPTELTEGPRGRKAYFDKRQNTDAAEAAKQPEAKKRKQEGTGPQDVPIPSSSSSSSSSESNCEEEDEGQGNTAIDKTGTSPEPQSEQHDSTHEAHQADEESLTEGERLARQALDMSASAKGMPIPEEENARGQCISFGAYAHGPFSGVTNAHFSICQQRLP